MKRYLQFVFLFLCIMPLVNATETPPNDDDLALQIFTVGSQALNSSEFSAPAQANQPRLLDVQVHQNRVTLNFNQAFGDYYNEDVFTNVINQIEALPDMNQFPVVEYNVLIERVPFNTLLPAVPDVSVDSPMTIVIPPADMQQPNATGVLAGRKIAISPGHGWTWYESCNCYQLQRGYWWGIVEDFVNAEIIMELYNILVNAGATVYPVRNLNKNGGIGVSGHPRWEENARRYLTELGLPSSVINTGTDAWASDLRSRPLYANYVNADILISLHNNGGCSNNCGTHGGTYILYDSTNGYQTQSLNLAQKVEAALVNQIRGSYDANWWNRGVAGFNGNYGENRLATRPSILVELAFMDQQYPDNAYLQDQSFRYIAAVGIYQGIVEYFGGSSASTPPPTYTVTPSSTPRPAPTPIRTPTSPPQCDYHPTTTAELIEAVNSANLTSTEDFICLSPGSIYTFTAEYQNGNALPDIINPLQIIGNGISVSRAFNAARFRLLQVYSTLTLTNIHISFFETTSAGGAIWVGSGGSLNMNKVSLNHNVAGTHGGAVYASDSTLNISNTMFYDNVAGDLGGGLYMLNSLGNLQNNSIMSNSAYRGGGIYNSGTQMITLTANMIDRNTATYGGGIYASASHMEIIRGVLSYNNASWGAGIYTLNTSTLDISHLMLLDNEAVEYGGAIYNNNNSQLTVSDSIIAYNSAGSYASGIYNRGNGSNAIVYNSNIVDNSSPFASAFLNADDTELAQITYSCIYNNTNVGVHNDNTIAIDAVNNWWGASSGPSGAGSGSGEVISSNVTYVPYQTVRFNVCEAIVIMTPIPTYTPTSTRTPTPTPTYTPIGFTSAWVNDQELLAALQAQDTLDVLAVTYNQDKLDIYVDVEGEVAIATINFMDGLYFAQIYVDQVKNISGEASAHTALINTHLPGMLSTAFDTILSARYDGNFDVESISVRDNRLYVTLIYLAP